MSERDDLAAALRRCVPDGTWLEAATRLLASDWLAAHDADVRRAPVVDQPEHTVAWQDKANIICGCGQVFSHDYGKSPAPILGSTSDYYLRTHCGTLYARHLRDVRTTDAADMRRAEREDTCRSCGHRASRHWLPGGCHGTSGSNASACRCAFTTVRDEREHYEGYLNERGALHTRPRSEVEKPDVTAERDALAATVERVRALCDDLAEPTHYPSVALRLRAAVDADQAPPTTSPDRHGHPDLTCDEAGCER